MDVLDCYYYCYRSSSLFLSLYCGVVFVVYLFAFFSIPFLHHSLFGWYGFFSTLVWFGCRENCDWWNIIYFLFLCLAKFHLFLLNDMKSKVFSYLCVIVCVFACMYVIRMNMCVCVSFFYCFKFDPFFFFLHIYIIWHTPRNHFDVKTICVELVSANRYTLNRMCRHTQK